MDGSAWPALILASLLAIQGIACAGASAATDEGDMFAATRRMAAQLGKQGLGKGQDLVLEYHLSRWTHTCAQDLPESRVRLQADGSLTLLRTRSHAESAEYGPGEFRGRIGKARWDSTFRALSRMRWRKQGFSLPMPGMAETQVVARLHHGGEVGEFEFTGSLPPGQDPVEEGLDALTHLLRASLADTLWELTLAGRKGKASRDGFLEGEWRLEGKVPVRIRLPDGGSPDGCNTLSLRYRMPGKLESVSAPLRPAPAGARVQVPITPDGWVELRPGTPLRLPVLPGKGVRVEESGPLTLVHLGLAVAAAGRSDTLALVTLFSDPFRP